MLCALYSLLHLLLPLDSSPQGGKYYYSLSAARELGAQTGPPLVQALPLSSAESWRSVTRAASEPASHLNAPSLGLRPRHKGRLVDSKDDS